MESIFQINQIKYINCNYEIGAEIRKCIVKKNDKKKKNCKLLHMENKINEIKVI